MSRQERCLHKPHSSVVSKHTTNTSNISTVSSQYPKLSTGGRSCTNDCWGCLLTAGGAWTGCACLDGSLCDDWSVDGTDGAIVFSLQCATTTPTLNFHINTLSATRHTEQC